MGWGRVIETELMPSLRGGNTEHICSKPKICNSFSKPNFELAASATVVAAVFNLGRNLMRAQYYRDHHLTECRIGAGRSL
jgi:hypothetical protein